MKKWLLAGGLTAGIVFGGLFLSGTDAQAAQRIADNVYIGSVDVSGMDGSQAAAAIADYAQQTGERTITLTSGERTLTVKASELGLSADAGDSVDAAMNYGKKGNLLERYRENQNIDSGKKKEFTLGATVDAEKVRKFLTDNEEALVDEPVDGTLKHENGTFTFVAGKEGHSLDIDASVAAVSDFAATDQANTADTIKLVTRVKKPRGTAEELSQVKDLLGTFSTNYSTSTAARKQNVANGESKISGTVLYPGDKFSVAKTLNPMTAENGYAEAPSYENGTTVLTYGGGICQVSTTLYNAVIRAELKVLKRYNHSMMVHYVQPSEDAAIAGNIKDFQFENDQKYPIFIEGSADGSTITFSIYGKETRDPSRSVDFESETTDTVKYKTAFKADPSQPVGVVSRTSDIPHDGLKAVLWKIVKENGKQVSRTQFNSSVYRATDATYAVGTKSDSSEAAAAMRAAIATGDLDKVQSAAAKWKNAASDEQQKDEEEKKKEETDKKDEKKTDTKKDEKDNKSKSGKDSGKDTKKVSDKTSDSKKK
ncbi:MAG: VanW family protein [Lachnospiraceae bacterium]|nr:VanW family protein [Lachnospiraceae bacterium]